MNARTPSWRIGRFVVLVLALLCLVTATGDARADVPPNSFSGTTGESAGGEEVVPVTGVMTYAVTFDLPANRGSSQPSLALSYTSGGRSDAAGWGWALNLPTIERAPLSGWPKYKDTGVAEEEDRYTYNGAPLTFICVVGSCPNTEAVGIAPSSSQFPTTGARYYRRQVDGGFERFYLSEDRQRWVVQRRGGEILELGVPYTRNDLQPTAATEVDSATGKIFRWNLAVQRDLHGTNNIVVYQWQHDGGPARKYLANIYYVPPSTGTGTATVGAFAYHVELKWASPGYRQEDRAAADRRPYLKRLRRVAISSKTWTNAANRELVRAYDLTYYNNRTVPGTATQAPFWGRSVLKSVVLEGRCPTAVSESNGFLPDPTNCPKLPATTFGYQPASLSTGAASRFDLPGLRYVGNAAILDVDRDGRPDILQSWPANPPSSGSSTITYTECSGQYHITTDSMFANPAVYCDTNPALDRSARPQKLWINKQTAAGQSFQHACLDTGAPGVGNSVVWVQTQGFFGTPGRVPSLFSSYGAEMVGDWGDGALLWSLTRHRAFGFTPASNLSYSDDDWGTFCPEAGVTSDRSYPAFAWKPTGVDADIVGSPTWAKNRVGTPAEDSQRTFGATDLDGDGYPDLVRDYWRPANTFPPESNGFRRVEVLFTRKYASNEVAWGTGTSEVRGPALVPFVPPPSPTLTIAGAVDSFGPRYLTYADLNGDGIQDIVSSPHGTSSAAEVRLGDGRGGFGCNQPGDAACTVAGNGSWLGPAYRLAFTDGSLPWPLQADSPFAFGTLSQLGSHRVHFFHDVTGDGLADLIAYTPRESTTGAASLGRIQLWINTDGQTFRCANPMNTCIVGTVSGTDQPASNGGPMHRIALLDVDGNGTQDFLLVGFEAAWTFSFLTPTLGSGPSAPRPGLLTSIDNGRGARTDVTYETLQTLAVAAASNYTSFREPWTTVAPTNPAVVTRILTRDTATASGGGPLPPPFDIQRGRRFEYHNPAYDLWDRSFRGFARVRAIEETTKETLQSWFYFGPCERSAFVPQDCVRGSDGGYDPVGGVINPHKAHSGALVRTDRFVLGVPGESEDKWLSTTTTKFAPSIEWIEPSEPNAAKRDRPVTLLQPVETITHLYDADLPVTNTVSDTLTPDQKQSAPDQSPPAVVLRSTVDYDNQGNVIKVARHGREGSDDSRIETEFLPENRCGSDWACPPRILKVGEFPVLFGVPSTVRRRISHTEFSYNDARDLAAVVGELFTIGEGADATLFRNTSLGTGAPSTALTAAGTYTLSMFDRDAFGNVTRARGGPGTMRSCSRATFDTFFSHLPATTTAYSGSDCTGNALLTELAFDRGLGEMNFTRHPNDTMSSVEFDGFGRVAKIYEPSTTGGPSDLSVELTHTTQAPVSWVRSKRALGSGQFQESYELFNGLGEHIMGFDQSEADLALSAWVLRDWTERDGKGNAVASYRPRFYNNEQGTPAALASTPALIPQTGNRLVAVRDDFGRVTQRRDGSLQTALVSHKPLKVTAMDAEQLQPGSAHEGRSSEFELDGHGRVVKSRVPGNDVDDVFTQVTYLANGSPIEIRRFGAFTFRNSVRTIEWDSFGRMIANHEPNTDGNGEGWRYVYDRESRLVGTSDARGCGKNIHYDALSRPIAEDFSPCLAPPEQLPYTAPNLTTGDGTEVFYRYDAYESGQMASTTAFPERASLAAGQLVSVRDRGAHTQMNYDERARIRRVSRRVVYPGDPSPELATRYTPKWYKQESTFDIADRLTKRTTGIDKSTLLPDVGGGVRESAETFAYSVRGLPTTIGSSYGTLVSELRYTASGLPTTSRYGDAAQTRIERVYDARERLSRYNATRAAVPALWYAATAVYPMPGPETTQLELMKLELAHDTVGNPQSISDTSTASWPAGARRVSRTYSYDSAYRVRQVDYLHAAGPDPYTSAFQPEASAGDRAPVAEREGSYRVTQQRFYHDAHGNLDYSDDNEQLTFDRSFGEQRNGFTAASPGGAGGPHQFLEGNDALAPSTAAYDLAGNMTELTVSRAGCWSQTPNCTHRFHYDWDEVGQMVRGRRWDFPAGEVPAYSPAAAPTWDLRYAHGFGGRTLTSKTDELLVTRHTLDIFDTLRVASVPYNEVSGDYTVRDEDEHGFLGGVGRVFIDPRGDLPQAGPTNVHVYLSIGDHLGSTAFVLDKDSGEVVERVQHQAYGKVESDYRPERWAVNREEFKFTGKEEDIEVGATYFGARFYSPQIGRWLSPDPLTIHGLAADPNPYAYVGGRVSAFIDPFGLAECAYGADEKTGACMSAPPPQTETSAPPPPPPPPAEVIINETQGAGGSAQPRVPTAREILGRGDLPLGNGRHFNSLSIPKAVGNGFLDAARTAEFVAKGPVGLAVDAATGNKSPLEGAHIATEPGDVGPVVVAVVPLVVGGAAAAGPAVRGIARRVLLGVSAPKLEAALTAAGISKPGGSIAHHIVGAAKRLEPAIAALKRFGIGPNAAENGVYLDKAIHQGLHTNAYYDAVNEALASASTKEEAIKALRTIASTLASKGTYP